MSRWLVRGSASLVVVVAAAMASFAPAAGTSLEATVGSSFGATAGASGDRTLVNSSQLRERPFRSVVLVAVGDHIVCTGFVIAPGKVVTAAHCLTRDASRGDFRFRPGLPGRVQLHRAYSQVVGGSPFASCGVSRAWAHPEFIRRDSTDRSFGSRAHDYAVLTTAADCAYPPSAVMRMWPTTASDGQLPTGSDIKLGGYPADARFADMNGLNLWISRGSIMQPADDERLIDTTGFVAQGMSGGPIWRSFGANSPCGRSQCVVGILTECAVNGTGQCKLGDSLRRAVRITPSVKEAIRKR